MKIRVLSIVFLAFLSCKNVTEKRANESKSDRSELLPEPDKVEEEKYLKNLNLTSFLENPIDWQTFKNDRNGDVTTGVTNGSEFYFNPKFQDSIFYSYNLITDSIGEKGINKAIVFKYGDNKHKYDDETEILIELMVSNKDLDLGKANLVGITKTELESEFGLDYLTWENGIAYSDKNKVLILELNKSKVKSYQYIKLNTEKIDLDLIGQIIK